MHARTHSQILKQAEENILINQNNNRCSNKFFQKNSFNSYNDSQADEEQSGRLERKKRESFNEQEKQQRKEQRPRQVERHGDSVHVRGAETS